MWFLFQVKRFSLIFLRESFLYAKKIFKFTKIQKERVLQNKGIPNLKKELKINLDKKYYDFYSLQPKLVKPFYIKSPLFTIIKKHKLEIFKNLTEIVKLNYNFKLKIGLEIEFYLKGNIEENITIKKLKKLFPDVQGIENENGDKQFEIKTHPYTDLDLLALDYLKIVTKLKTFSKNNKYDLKMEASPFLNDCGNSLQVNVSLIDNNNNNLFKRKQTKYGLIESDIMLNSIAGLLKNINNNLLLYIENENCLKRFDIEKNILVRNSNKYPAPTFISWGINNRSASIRIPTPSKIDLDNYLKNDSKNRRIEYRMPSSSADIYLVLIGIITAIIEGLEKNLKPHIKKTSFDVLNNQENFEKINTDYKFLNDNFKLNENLLFVNRQKI